MELVDLLKKLARLRGTTLEHEVARHNVGIMEQRREWAAQGRPLPCENEEERVARFKAARKRGVDKAREKRRAARAKLISSDERKRPLGSICRRDGDGQENACGGRSSL